MDFYDTRAVKELNEATKGVVDLANDVIDYWPMRLPTGKLTDLAIRSASLFSLLHVAWPLSAV